jgi:hypothetical protein
MADTKKYTQDMEHALWRVTIVQGLLASHRVLRTHDLAWQRKESDLATRLEIAKEKLVQLESGTA